MHGVFVEIGVDISPGVLRALQVTLIYKGGGVYLIQLLDGAEAGNAIAHRGADALEHRDGELNTGERPVNIDPAVQGIGDGRDGVI